MFPYSRQQPSAVATANFRTLVNVTKRYASGLQQLAKARRFGKLVRA
jgi:hypothetical protein